MLHTSSPIVSPIVSLLKNHKCIPSPASSKKCTHKQNIATGAILLIVLLYVCCGVVVVPSHATATTTTTTTVDRVLITYSRTPVFTGSLQDCLLEPNNTACVWGLPAALAEHRQLVNTTNATSDIFIPDIDTRSAFINIHPEKAGLNIKLYKLLNISHYTSDPWLLRSFESHVPIGPFLTDDVIPIMTTHDVVDTHKIYLHLHRYVLLQEGRLAILSVGNSQQSTSSSSALVSNLIIPRLRVTVEHLRLIGVKVIVMMCDDPMQSTTWYANNMGSGIYAVDVVVDLQAKVDKPCASVTVGNNTSTNATTSRRDVVICGAAASNNGMLLSSSIIIETHNENSNVSATILSSTSSPSTPSNNNEAITDDLLYFQHRDMVHKELQAALDEDVVVGHTDVVIPAATYTITSNNNSSSNTSTTADDEDVETVYPCFTEECPLATLLARSYLYNYPHADIAMLSAGTLVSSTSPWQVGNITSSQMWGTFSFPVSYCVGRIIGLKLYQIINATLAAATFKSDSSGHQLLHLGNAEIEINPNQSTHLLTSLKIRNNKTGVYEPLDRLQYYTFVTNAYQCDVHEITSPLFTTLLEGETKMVLEETLEQSGLKKYLQDHTPYNLPLTSGYMRFFNNTGSINQIPASMVWSTEEVSCGALAFWSVGMTSCVPCPVGQKGAGQVCIYNQKNNSKLYLIWQIGAPLIATVLIMCAVAVCVLEWRRRRGTRNTTNAPRGGGDLAIILTDIQASTKLWGAAPASMAAALGQHNAVIRKEIAKHNGYEVKTVGDSFMIALTSAQDAVELAVSIQRALHRQAWPKAIDQVYNANTDESSLAAVVDDVDGEWIPELIGEQQTPTKKKSRSFSDIDTDVSGFEMPRTTTTTSTVPVFRGLRVRIGIHYGPFEVTFDTVAKGYDYHGPEILIAAKVEEAGRGGQILVSQQVVAALSLSTTIRRRDTWTIGPHSTLQLRNTSSTKTNNNKIQLSEVTVTKLPPRDFFSLAEGDGGDDDILTTTPRGTIHSFMSASSQDCDDWSFERLLEQDLAYECLEVYMSVVPQNDRDMILRTLGRAWGLEWQESSPNKVKQDMLATRAGYRLRRVLDPSSNHMNNNDGGDGIIVDPENVPEILTTLPNEVVNGSYANTPSSSHEMAPPPLHAGFSLRSSLMCAGSGDFPSIALTPVSSPKNAATSRDDVADFLQALSLPAMPAEERRQHTTHRQIKRNNTNIPATTAAVTSRGSIAHITNNTTANDSISRSSKITQKRNSRSNSVVTSSGASREHLSTSYHRDPTAAAVVDDSKDEVVLRGRGATTQPALHQDGMLLFRNSNSNNMSRQTSTTANTST